MLIKPVVFSRQNGIAHTLRNSVNLDHRTAFLTELSNELPFQTEYPQGHLRLIVGENTQIWQRGRDNYCCKNNN